MTMLGADVEGLERTARKCSAAADTADDIRQLMQAIVIALRALETFTGPWAEALIRVLTTLVIPWLQRIAQALKLFAMVLGRNAQAQRDVSEGKPVDFGSLPCYPAPSLPAGATAVAAASATGTFTVTVTPAGVTVTPGVGAQTADGTTYAGAGVSAGGATGPAAGTIIGTGTLDGASSMTPGGAASGPPSSGTINTTPIAGDGAMGSGSGGGGGSDGGSGGSAGSGGGGGSGGGAGSSGGGGFSSGGPNFDGTGSLDPAGDSAMSADSSAAADGASADKDGQPTVTPVQPTGSTAGHVATLSAAGLGAGVLGGLGAYAANRRGRPQPDGSESFPQTARDGLTERDASRTT